MFFCFFWWETGFINNPCFLCYLSQVSRTIGSPVLPRERTSNWEVQHGRLTAPASTAVILWAGIWPEAGRAASWRQVGAVWTRCGSGTRSPSQDCAWWPIWWRVGSTARCRGRRPDVRGDISSEPSVANTSGVWTLRRLRVPGSVAMEREAPSLAGLLSPWWVTVLVSNWWWWWCGGVCKGEVGSPGLALLTRGSSRDVLLQNLLVLRKKKYLIIKFFVRF